MIVYVIEPKNWAIIKTVDIASLDAPIFSNDNSSGTLVLPSGITPEDNGNVIVTKDAKYAWVIMGVKPSDTNVTVTLGDIFNLFDRSHYYTQPSAVTPTEQFAYDLLNTQYVAISDAEYKFNQIDLAWSGSTNFIQPVCSDGNLFKASDYLRMIAQNGVKFEFAYQPRLSVTISERIASHTNLMFNDGHSQLVSKEFASEITSKVTVYSGTSSTNYYLQSNGSISTTAPTPRIKGKWAAINTTDDIDNAVRAVFAKNTNTQKFEFYSDKELEWNGEVWMLIDGERYKATISSVRINSDDVRYKFIAGDLATTLTEKLTQVQKPIQYQASGNFESVAISFNTTNTQAGASSIKYISQLDEVHARIYCESKTTLNAGSTYTIGTIGNRGPSVYNALAAFSTKNIAARITNVGVVQVIAYESVPAGTSIFIRGIWDV